MHKTASNMLQMTAKNKICTELLQMTASNTASNTCVTKICTELLQMTASNTASNIFSSFYFLQSFELLKLISNFYCGDTIP